VLLGQDTLYRALFGEPDGVRLAATDQAVPFQDSARVRPTPSLFWYLPTATHPDAVPHEIAFSELPWVPPGFGDCTTDQWAPFQDSTNVTSTEAALRSPPTATHADAPVHETADSVLLLAPGRFGLGMIDHAAPFQNSVSVS
jgi:hypothetical protein